MEKFILHEKLDEDSILLKELGLSQLRYLPDPQCPWLILVPRVPEIRELHQLSEKDQAVLIHEACEMARLLEAEFRADKINMGALGNLVEQLHFHVIARFRDDRAWPGPIWGVAGEMPGRSEEILERIKKRLEG